MPSPNHCLALLGTLITTISALPNLATREPLAYRSWDLRLFNANPPTCNANDSNIDLTIFHRYGAYDRTCQPLEPSYNVSSVKSLSWKSPDQEDWHDLCMFREADCSGGQAGLVDVITDGWEVCYPYTGWRGWTVVEHGSGCL